MSQQSEDVKRVNEAGDIALITSAGGLSPGASPFAVLVDYRAHSVFIDSLLVSCMRFIKFDSSQLDAPDNLQKAGSSRACWRLMCFHCR